MGDGEGVVWWFIVAGVSLLLALVIGLVGQYCGFDPASMPR